CGGILDCGRCQHRGGSLWARHAHADLADMRNGGQLATGERGGGVVLASDERGGGVGQQLRGQHGRQQRGRTSSGS
ncbi:hypothetical protein ACLOJK_007919, partial [Asimina triloba]